ncbi:MAG: ABC transporter transmembrane domain-containing protein, partial [Pseudomonadota bacterium]
MANTEYEQHQREKSRDLRALSALWPFVRPYRGLLALAGIALLLTAAVSLVLPIAARRVVEGFETGQTELLDGYFMAALGIALLLAAGSGLRYYFVTRLGERVVADIRIAVFDRMIRMSPAFFERLLTGEILSRITTDTTLILSVIGSSVSWALRNALLLIGAIALMVYTSPKLSMMVLLVVPLVIGPIVILGRRLRRLSRKNQDWIAASSGAASEGLLAAQAVQANTHEDASNAAFSDVTEKSFDTAKARIFTRAIMSFLVIAMAFGGIVGVLWMGARDVQSGAMTTGELVQFVIYAGMVAGSTGALSEIWGELQRAAGATERLVELLEAEDTVRDAARPAQLTAPVRGQIAFDDVTFRYP